jgi:hypothetical protein
VYPLLAYHIFAFPSMMSFTSLDLLATEKRSISGCLSLFYPI